MKAPAAAAIAYCVCAVAVAGGFWRSELGTLAPYLAAAQLCLLLLAAGLLLARAIPAVMPPLLVSTSAAAVVLPHPLQGLGALGGLLLAVVGGFLAYRAGRRGWVLAAALVFVAAIVRGALDLVWPELAPAFCEAGLWTLGAALLAWVAWRLALSTRAAAWTAIACCTAAAGLVIVPSLSPATQFDVVMALFLVAFIILAGILAATFAYLFLKTFERLDRNLVEAYLFFLPLCAAPLYLLAGALSRLQVPAPAEQWHWMAWSFALDGILAASALLLLGLRAAGRSVAPRAFVPLVAWKFLRSQRIVPTAGTRRSLALRKLVTTTRGSWGRAFLEMAAAAGILAGACLLVPLLVGPNASTVLLVRVALTSAGSAYFCARALLARSTAATLFFLPALASAGWALALARDGAAENLSNLLGLAPLAALALPVLLLVMQYGVRWTLLIRRRSGNLPAELDPRLAPKMVTRLREGVGASIFSSVVGVAIGVWALVLVLSVMGGFSGDLEARIVHTKDHIMVKATHEAGELADPVGLARRIAALPGVASASPYVEGEAMMSSSINISSTVTVRGIDKGEAGTSFLKPSVVVGSLDFFSSPERLLPFPGVHPFLPYGPATASSATPAAPLLEMPEIADDGEAEAEPAPESDGLFPMPAIEGEEVLLPQPETLFPEMVATGADDPALPPIIIGQELARSLAVGVGGTVTVISPDGEVGPMGIQPKARAFLVAAIFATGMYEYDLKLAYMGLPDAQRFFNLGEVVEYVDVRLTDLKAAGAIRHAILSLDDVAPAVEVLTWEQMNRNLLSALELERIVMFVVLGFIILIASFNVVASLVVLIRKRQAAIAILRTMGAASREIMALFLLLGSAAGLFGMAAGVLMGLSSCGIIQHVGITLPKEYYVRDLPVAVDGWQVAQVALAALLITMLASAYPGRLASRALLVEGLKDER
jgi:lipoprotein-releasing system permease protein